MNWVTIIWSLSAGACITLGVTHLMIWLASRTAYAHLAFAIAAVGTAGVAGCELLMLSAPDPQTFGRVLRWSHLPVTAMMVALACFVRFYFQTGRPWLFWLTIGIRLSIVLVNFLQPLSINLQEITALKQIPFLGQQVSIVAEAVTNPWNRLSLINHVILLLFLMDATHALWRKGDANSRRRAFYIGGSLMLFVVLAAGHTSLVNEQVIQYPYLISFPFMFIILAMAGQLGHDLSEKARLTVKFHDSQEQMILAAAAGKLALWTWDVRTNRIWVTEAGRDLYGVSSEEDVSIERFLDTLHPEDRESVRLALDATLSGKGDFSMDYRVLLPDGQTRWMTALGKMEFGVDGAPLRLRGISKDITNRIQAEERSRLVLEAAPNGMVMVDERAEIVLVNRQAELLFGYPREELMGQPIQVLIPDRFKADHPAMHRHFFANPTARPMGAGRELFARRKDGTEVAVEIGLTPVHTSLQTFVLASITDITERKRAERESMEQRDELFHLSRVSSLGQLSGSLAHELNQPLGIILSNAQAAQRMLAQESPDLAELREILSDIVSEDRRAGEVITRLRALLKRGETQLRPLAINEVIQALVPLLRSDLVSRGVTLHTALAEDLPDVAGDQVQIQQVLLNLITNGCDAMADNSPNDRILTISTYRHEGKVRLSVEDQGCGLQEGGADRIFQPFVTTKTHGLGIGLSISSSIIAAHHGRLWAEPNQGRGTTFFLELQLADIATS